MISSTSTSLNLAENIEAPASRQSHANIVTLFTNVSCMAGTPLRFWSTSITLSWNSDAVCICSDISARRLCAFVPRGDSGRCQGWGGSSHGIIFCRVRLCYSRLGLRLGLYHMTLVTTNAIMGLTFFPLSALPSKNVPPPSSILDDLTLLYRYYRYRYLLLCPRQDYPAGMMPPTTPSYLR